MLENDVLLAKISVISNCIKTVHLVVEDDFNNLDDFFKRDVFVLNLQRAVQACIDIANHIILKQDFGIPRSYGHAFELLLKNRYIDQSVYTKMKNMIGFRNIAVHEYQEIDTDILKSIYENNLSDFEEFLKQVLTKLNLSSNIRD